MTELKSRLLLEPTDDARNFTLGTPLIVSSDILGELEIPEGFLTDGASIPLGLRWLFPFGGKKILAAVIHDYLYGANICEKWEADLVFKEFMEYKGVEPWRISTMYNGVKYLGGSAWTTESTGI